jgi:hypothetical protein
MLDPGYWMLDLAGVMLRAEGARFREKRIAEYRITNFEGRNSVVCSLSSDLCLLVAGRHFLCKLIAHS